MNKNKIFYSGNRNSLVDEEKTHTEALENIERGEAGVPSRVPAEISVADRRIGTLYKPVKQRVTIRLDADLLDWFREKSRGKGYQTMINRVLREYMLQEMSGDGRDEEGFADSGKSCRD